MKTKTLSTTAQVRLLCERLLSDGMPHARSEIETYIENQMKIMGQEKPSPGCLAGGIRSAVIGMNCEKVGTATYKASMKENKISRLERAADCIDMAEKTVTSLAREIDFLEAESDELRELGKLKHCVRELRKLKGMLDV